jgi:hypothetical protein
MAAPQQLPQLFGIIPTNLPCITTPTSCPSPISFLFSLPSGRPFSHIVVFLLPGITLPPNSAAAVYLQLPGSPNTQPNFKFLGGVGPGKESAIFSIKGLRAAGTSGANGVHEVDMDAPEDGQPTNAELTLGISIESADSVSAQMAALSSSSTSSITNPSSALVVAKATQVQKPNMVLLAQRIIKNAFNFLASFSGNTANGVEVVPLKAFEDWWRKFEGRVRNDPGFLERDGD